MPCSALAGAGFAHIVERKVIEHDSVGTGSKRLLKFIDILDCHFHRFTWRVLTGLLNSLSNASSGSDVIFFD